MYLFASMYMIEWYYNDQQARGLSNKVLACFAMSAVLASAGSMVAGLAPRVWRVLSETEASQAVSFSFCLTWCTTPLRIRNVSPLASAGLLCVSAIQPNGGLGGCRASSQQQQPVPAGRLWQLQCGFGRAFVSGQAPGPSSLSLARRMQSIWRKPSTRQSSEPLTTGLVQAARLHNLHCLSPGTNQLQRQLLHSHGNPEGPPSGVASWRPQGQGGGTQARRQYRRQATSRKIQQSPVQQTSSGRFLLLRRLFKSAK